MNSIIIIITGILGSTFTFYMSSHLKQGAVRSSALLSLIVGLFFYWFPEILNTYLTENIPLVFITASFIGMVSSKTIKSYGLLAVAGSLCGIIYINKSEFFDGFGGALGTLAFIALLTTLGLSTLLSKNKKIARVVSTFKKRVLK